MTDIVERLQTFYTSEDHERGCKGRECECSCGYENNGHTLITEAADEIERLTGERDRQYDYNCGQIVRIASLEAEIERMRAALMILKDANENGNSPSVVLQDVIEAALEGK